MKILPPWNEDKCRAPHEVLFGPRLWRDHAHHAGCFILLITEITDPFVIDPRHPEVVEGFTRRSPGIRAPPQAFRPLSVIGRHPHLNIAQLGLQRAPVNPVNQIVAAFKRAGLRHRRADKATAHVIQSGPAGIPADFNELIPMEGEPRFEDLFVIAPYGIEVFLVGRVVAGGIQRTILMLGFTKVKLDHFPGRATAHIQTHPAGDIPAHIKHKDARLRFLNRHRPYGFDNLFLFMGDGHKAAPR